MDEVRVRGRLTRGLATALTVLGIVVATTVGLDSWAEAAALRGTVASGALSMTGARLAGGPQQRSFQTRPRNVRPGEAVR